MDLGWHGDDPHREALDLRRDQVAHDAVVLDEAALHGNLAQHGFENVLLAGNFLHFAVGNFWRFQHRQRDQFRAIPDEDRAILLAARTAA